MTTIPTLSRRLPALCTARGSLAYTAATRFSVSSQQQARYSSYSSRHENDPDKLHDHKQNSLKEQKDGKGQWHEELASDAEAFVSSSSSLFLLF
ncbi:hypothetical protein TWF506_011305 [Arthrobotrys conoides]|uniref:Uncharacterized protein n=1 Tax=Arthrobotrys conoides TaxID=74498 RepID=A0AAN8N615_9PEZI